MQDTYAIVSLRYQPDLLVYHPDCRVATVRGKVAARDGVFVGEFGRGKFLEREPTHF